MLDTATKRRIDSARDILVGKVPDPKSQVEQITIALIYKFMDDMDAESEEMGGQRKFFTGDYARYGWATLMRSGLGGHETLNLYAEGIAKMPENAGIPPLFRDIFKNAYLPYRDPETLKSFLKIIDDFSYDHSERLGDAFEYLLSVLGSQGDAGQFRTPRHIIDFMVAMLDPKKTETVLDPACGTAGFLISSWKHILKANSSSPSPAASEAHASLPSPTGANSARLRATGSRADERPSATREGWGGAGGEGSAMASGDLLTPDERARLARNFKGYDISPDMVRLSLVNLYLHGFSDPHIVEYDTLTSDERWNEHADVILANPPFMSPKGGIKPHNRFSIQAKRSEVLFVDYMAEHLSPNGRAGIIVPEGIIFQSQGAYTQLRKLLVEQYLVAVVSLPAGVFQPYSGVKTSILILDKSLARHSDRIAFFKVENDGYGLGAQRRAIEHNDLPAAAAALRSFTHSRESGNPADCDLSQHRNLLVVEKSRIAANGDYNLSGERYREGGAALSEYPHVTLGEVCEINPDTANPAELYPNSHFNYIDISCVENESGKFLGPNKTATDEAPSRARRSVKQGDVLMSTVRPNLKAFALLTEIPERAIASTGFAVLRAKPERLLPGFLINVLRDDKSVDQMIGMAGKGAYPSINQTDVESVQIPLPPLEVQKEIVAEIEGCQKVIDGARAVLDHYRPHIPIHPDWPMVELGKVCEKIMDGTHFSPSNNETGERPYITSKNVRENYLDLSNVTYISEEAHQAIYSRCPVRTGDVLYIKDGANTGLAAINTLTEEFSLLSSVAVMRGTPEILDNRYLAFYLNSDRGRQSMLSLISGVAITRLTLTKLNSALIPLPPLATQQAIVAEIEAEQALVAANRELIARFEQKIQITLARVWGEEVELADSCRKKNGNTGEIPR